MVNDINELYDAPRTAKTLGISLATLRGWCSKRRIPHIKVGRRVLFDPADLAAFIESRRVETFNKDDHII